jgi:hypothetical protein
VSRNSTSIVAVHSALGAPAKVEALSTVSKTRGFRT